MWSTIRIYDIDKITTKINWNAYIIATNNNMIDREKKMIKKKKSSKQLMIKSMSEQKL